MPHMPGDKRGRLSLENRRFRRAGSAVAPSSDHSVFLRRERRGAAGYCVDIYVKKGIRRLETDHFVCRDICPGLLGPST